MPRRSGRALRGQDPFHNYVHRWVSGHMETGASPNDPIFFLHHCNIDRLWAMWQMDGHAGAGGYPNPVTTSFSTGHNLTDRMWPWVGTTVGYSVSIEPDAIAALPDFSGEPERTPADLLNHRDIVVEIAGIPTQLGFAYDTEVVVGVSLDRSNSMTGDTPDPMTGAGTISTWDAARQGVAHFLQDCEAAYQAAEAYVVSGIQTFHTVGGSPNYSTVFSATPAYGLIKPGGTYTAAAFTAAAGGMSPSGSTPLAGALIETEDDLVRPPHGNLPASDLRYQYILTDGKRTAGPLLSSLAEPEFPNTTIFAMGFGVGSGWDGVDYATVEDLTKKGRVAPPGVAQVYHGENAGEINKFFTNSIAASIGYVPVVDPTYELFAGEHSMTLFQATSADSSFFISVVGFDYNDKNWMVMLKAPDGREYVKPVTSPVLYTVRRAQGKFSIFLNRGSAPDEAWIGRWYVMVHYKPQANRLGMLMYSPFQALIPTGAPPIRGPLFSRAKLTAARRPTQRLSAPTPGNFVQPGVGVSAPPSGVPGSVAVDVFAKTRLRVDLDVGPAVRFAGDAITADIRIDTTKGQLRDLNVHGRVISPGYSIGNLITDTKTIPLAKRKQFIDTKNGVFDELSFLAQYEKLKPMAFRIHDRKLNYRGSEKTGSFVSVVKQTRYPGVYRITAHVDGIWQPKKGPAERFTRVLSKEVGIGIKVDSRVARPTLHWLSPDRFIVRLFAADALGNIASVTRMDTPVLQFRRETIPAVHRASNDGWHELEVQLEGRSINLALDGLSVRGASVSCPGGESLVLDKLLPNTISVEIGHSVLKVTVPAMVGDTTSMRVFPAGSGAVQKIQLDRRVAFPSLNAATIEGFRAGGTTESKRGTKSKSTGKKKGTRRR